MPASVWVYQDWRQVQEKGEAKASWFVGWYNLEGKRRSKSFGAGSFGKMKANKYRAKMEEELNGGLYQELLKKTWQDFRREYEEKILEALAPRTRDEAISALVHFERIIKPVRMGAITARSIDQYASNRRKEPGKKKGDMVSPATVNKELRHIKAALRLAFEWSYLAQLPRVRMQKAPTKLATYVTGEHFAAIYQACDKATFPEDQRYEPADWWRGLIVMGYMTGWRISDMLGLRREDLDLDSAFAITRARDNKAKRDERVKLHPVVVDHLRRLVGFDVRVFPWNKNRRTLDTEFAWVQQNAGIHLACQGQHEHTPSCHVYGFHDLRRAFATMNADKLTPDTLQALMRHKSYQTTQVYINMARQMDGAVAGLHVPDVLSAKKG